jgi:hypothetical protein
MLLHMFPEMNNFCGVLKLLFHSSNITDYRPFVNMRKIFYRHPSFKQGKLRKQKNNFYAYLVALQFYYRVICQ